MFHFMRAVSDRSSPPVKCVSNKYMYIKTCCHVNSYFTKWRTHVLLPSCFRTPGTATLLTPVRSLLYESPPPCDNRI